MVFGLNRRVAIPWIFDNSLHLLGARQSIPGGREYNETRLIARNALIASSRRNRGGLNVLWLKSASGQLYGSWSGIGDGQFQ